MPLVTPSPSLATVLPRHKCYQTYRSCKSRAVAGDQMAAAPATELLQERGIVFQPGSSFFRPQSIFARDLATLSATLLRQKRGGSLHVLDLMAGSGVRGMRYLQQAGATSMWCNDCSPATHAALAANLSAAVAASLGEGSGQGTRSGAAAQVDQVQLPLLDGPAWDWQLSEGTDGENTGSLPIARLTHEEGNRLLMWCALQRQQFDLIDIDSFGGNVSYVGLALGALRYGGLMCLTSTAGPLAAGRDPASALAMLGMHLAPVPHANEQGLRMLLGVACREALQRGLVLTPLWSLYSPHGPVYRVMVRVGTPGSRQEIEAMQGQLGFVVYDDRTGEASAAGWRNLSAVLADTTLDGVKATPPSPSLSGPFWVGPLQDRHHLGQLSALAKQHGWQGRGSCAAALPHTKKGSGVRSLGELLQLLAGESDPRLPSWHFTMDEIASRGRLSRPPSRNALVSALTERGYCACLTHIDSQAVRTDASLAQVIDACRTSLGVPGVG